MPSTQDIAHIQSLNMLLKETLGTSPAFSWQWGDELVYWQEDKKVLTSQSEGGIYLVERKSSAIKVKLPMDAQLRNKWIFCVLGSPAIPIEEWPYAIAPYPIKGMWTMFGIGAGIVSRSQENLPTVDLTIKLIHLVRSLAKPLQDQTDAQLMAQFDADHEAQKKKLTNRLIEIRNDAYPVGGFRMPGEKTTASFATPDFLKHKKD